MKTEKKMEAKEKSHHKTNSNQTTRELKKLIKDFNNDTIHQSY